MPPKKSLGQHWLFDEAALGAMLAAGEVTKQDTVLEVGPGLGNLTNKLCQQAKQVVAIEKDEILAKNLLYKDKPCFRVYPCNIVVVAGDVLKYDFRKLPKGYKVVANIPYYLTSNLIRVLLESSNPPNVVALLVQKEVAQRIVAAPGQMSILSVSVQFYATAKVFEEVPAKLFIPPPKVDSQIIQIKKRGEPLFPDIDVQKFFQLVKAGFSEKRKKLRSSLSGGLRISKTEADELLKKAKIPLEARAQELTLDQWHNLYSQLYKKEITYTK